jgi:hypothetical protein
MENMGSVFMNIDTILFFRKYITAYMGTLVDYKTFFTPHNGFMGND